MMILTELTGAALFFIALWITVCYFVGFLSGWHELARAYRHAGTFVGVRWRFQSGRMRLWMGLHNILTIGINPQGLYLATFVLSRADTPPLLIPWHDISPQPGKFLFWKYVEFRFRQAPSVFLRLSFSLAERMRAAAGDSWPLDRGAIWPF